VKPGVLRSLGWREVAEALRAAGARERVHPADCVGYVYTSERHAARFAAGNQRLGNETIGPVTLPTGETAHLVCIVGQLEAKGWSVAPPEHADDWLPGGRSRDA
jgi:hypothetical protein